MCVKGLVVSIPGGDLGGQRPCADVVCVVEGCCGQRERRGGVSSVFPGRAKGWDEASGTCQAKGLFQDTPARSTRGDTGSCVGVFCGRAEAHCRGKGQRRTGHNGDYRVQRRRCVYRLPCTAMSWSCICTSLSCLHAVHTFIWNQDESLMPYGNMCASAIKGEQQGGLKLHTKIPRSS